MGKKRQAQNLNIPIKLGTDMFFIEMDVNPGADADQIIATAIKDDGTKVNFKGNIPEINWTDAEPLNITINLTKIN